MISNKAQAWGFDLIIAGVIFMSGILLFYVYSINYPKESYEKLDQLFNEGEFMAEVLLSEGLPKYWNQENVVRIGLTSNKKINETKLEEFYYMTNSQEGYAKAKRLFNTRYNFFMKFSEEIIIEGNPIVEGGIGQNFEGHEVKNLAKITRVTAYQDKLISLDLYIWE